MADVTDRFHLPFIIQGQSQKEVTHNEALTLADLLMNPVIQAVAPAFVPAAPSAGHCWIVGTGSAGAWAGRDGHIAGWTGGGWRFIAPMEGICVWSVADNVWVQSRNGTWDIGAVHANTYAVDGTIVLRTQQPAIVNPIAGAVMDSEARFAIVAILSALRSHGLIAI